MRIDLFVEDNAHEQFARALIQRLATEEEVDVEIRVVTARGGHGRVMTELDLYQRIQAPGAPDALVILIDGNCQGWNTAKQQITASVRVGAPVAVVGCPDPHIERWYMADAAGLREELGAAIRVEKRKCERGRYKRLLAEALAEAGHVLTLDGIEFAQEIVSSMDLFRAAKSEPSLKAFVDDVRALLRRQENGDDE